MELNLITFGVLLICLGARSDPNDDGLRNFVAHTMLGFQDWAIQEGLDPMLPVDRNFTLSVSSGILSLAGEIGNISNLGLSTGSFTWVYVPTSFTNKMIEIGVSLETGGLTGNYNATGTVLGTYPIGGNSWWRLTSNNFYINFKEKFYLENGYIRLNDSYTSSSEPEVWFYLDTLAGSFNGLLTPDTEQYEGQILSTIAQQITQITRYDNLLFYSVFYRYLQEAFEGTPVSEVINWPAPSTMPPPTTLRPTTSSRTTTRLTTTPPTTPDSTTDHPTIPDSTTAPPTTLATTTTRTTAPVTSASYALSNRVFRTRVLLGWVFWVLIGFT